MKKRAKKQASKPPEQSLVSIELNVREVVVDGKQLPLRIGDKIVLASNDRLEKTVMALTVFEDGRVQYMLEWYDPEACQFQNETVTWSELKLLGCCAHNITEKIGFS